MADMEKYNDLIIINLYQVWSIVLKLSFLTKNDEFYLKPKINSRMAQAWDQGELSPWLRK